jgi:mannose-1-phosphate guanylyltransferase (GDP) (EC 2.7.7.22)
LGVPLSGIILEPEARNTAAAIAVAAVIIGRDFGNHAVMQILPSDHEILADETYTRCVEMAAEAARQGKIVTFGITPTEPATGYGYIEMGKALPGGAHTVKRFVEKPKLENAKAMLEAGGYFWNSGMFTSTAGQMLAELREHAPEVLAAAEEAVAEAATDLDFVRLDAAGFAKSPSISIDYAVMEKTPNVAVVPAPIPGRTSAAGMRSGRSAIPMPTATSSPVTPPSSTPAIRW